MIMRRIGLRLGLSQKKRRGGGVVRPLVPYLFASIGDSNMDLNTRFIEPPAASPSSSWFSDGPLAKFRSMSKQRINFPVSYEKGVSGEKIQDNLARISQITTLNPKPDFCFINVGSNNVTSTDTLADMTTAIEALANAVHDADIIPIIYHIPPRQGAVLTAPQLQKQLDYNAHLDTFVAATPWCRKVDARPYIVDPNSSTNQPLPNMVKADNLHYANTGGYWVGKATLEQCDDLLPEYVPFISTSADFYHATNNPGGSLLHSGATAYSTMAGTTGTHTNSTGFTSSGQLATGFTSIRSGGATSTCTAVLSKVARFDGEAGNAQRVVLNVTAAGGADEIHNLRATPVFADTAADDMIYAEVKIKITDAPVNINAIELYLLETRPTNSQTAIDGAYNSTLSLLLPSVTGEEILRTPPIKRQSDATALQVNIRTRMNTTSGTAGVGYEITDYVVRKVV